MSNPNPFSPGARALVLAALLALPGCTTVSNAWDSTTDTIGGLFGDDDDAAATDEATASDEAAAEAPASGGLVTGTVPGAGGASGAFRSTARGAPDLASVPSQAPTPPSSTEDRRRATEGLIADRERANYTDQVGRREPVTVRPLDAGGADTAIATPPVPEAARAAPVTRVADVTADAAPSSAPATAPVSPRTTDLAERLGAAPPPPPPPVSGATAPPTPIAAVSPAPAPIAPAPTAAAATQALVPQYVAPQPDYGAETMVIDSSGVQGGGSGAGRQLALAAPRASFDPGNASVSSQIGAVIFAPGSAALSAAARAVLADAARLRADVDGAIRVVARGDQAQARAAAVTRELRRLGVPAARLYDGAADGFGEETEIYLDY
ncbi:MAG: hypothetical protein SFV21_21840 [Rhodospirillaceae bacterium]|nr:hypothetical protein [Rhodospirillaceae bacterium]